MLSIRPSITNLVGRRQRWEISYAELVGKLKARFGAVGLQERFATELRSRRRRHGETLAELHADIKRLMALAYPDAAQSQLGLVIARDHFISALNDRELELKVRDRDPSDLETAFRAAIRIETHLKAYEAEHEREAGRDNRQRRDRYDENRVRQAGRPTEVTSQDEVSESVLAKVLAQLEKAQKERDEMSKEAGRWKLIAEQSKLLSAAPGLETEAQRFPQ